ncbi:MAG: DUF4391 domain-containing protein [Thermovirgaceae bacterium]|jgi:hypothetical protein
MKAPFAFPKKAFVGRMLPKNRIYEHASPTKVLKELFVREVDRITWSYKLSPETVNLPAGDRVKEFQVFTVSLKTDLLKKEILQAIDKAIPSPIIYEITFRDRMRYAASFKRPSESDRSGWVVSGCFESEWMNQNVPKVPLPVLLDLESLYHYLLRGIIGLKERPDENIEELVQRAERIAVLEREANLMALGLERERQFNRKVEINSKLKTLRSRIEELRQ